MGRPVAPRGEGRERVLEAALTLFAEYGVGQTSLQMIADELGVTKAAVYFQFKAKEEIVLAVLQPAFDDLAAFVPAAEALPNRAARLDAALVGLVDLVLAHRRIAAVLRGDRAAAQIIRTHRPLLDLIDRLSRLLTGPRPALSDQVAVAMVGGGLMLLGTETDLVGVDADTLRPELLAHARALLGVTATGVPRRRASARRAPALQPGGPAADG